MSESFAQSTVIPSRWVLVGIVVVAVAFGLATYPTVEGWGIWHAFDVHGLGFYVASLPTQAERPLHMVSYLMAWLLPGDYGTGSMLIGGFYALTRGLLLWVLARMQGLRPAASGLLLVMGLLQPGWPGAPYERYHSAQLAFLCFLAGWCCFLGGESRQKWVYPVLAAVVWLFGFLSYPGLFVVLGLSPLAFAVYGERNTALRLAVVVAPIGMLYLGWYFLASHFVAESYLNQLSTKAAPLLLGRDLYKGFGHANGPTKLSWLIVALSGVVLFPLNDRLRQFTWPMLVVGGAVLSALIFGKNRAWLTDPERILYPAMAWLCVCLLASRSTLQAVMPLSRWQQCLTVLGLLTLGVCGGLALTQAHREVYTQQRVLEALEELPIQWTEQTRVCVVEPSGDLGRLYTFLDPQLDDAWQAKGRVGYLVLAREQPTDTPGSPPFRHVVMLRRKPAWFRWFAEWTAELQEPTTLPPPVEPPPGRTSPN